MSRFRSDVVAVACILGGAAVGVGATLARMDPGEHGHPGCGVERMAVSPRIAISGRGEARAIVVTPDVRVHSVQDCGSNVHEMVEIHMDNHLHDFEAQLEKLDQVIEIQMEGLEAQIEAEIEAEMEAQFQFEEAVREFEEAKIKMVIEKVGSGGS